MTNTTAIDLLVLEDVKAGYGHAIAITDVSFTIARSQVVALIGINGAGKSTTLKTIAGVLKQSQGKIALEGEEISSVSPQARLKKGISLCPEGRHVFSELTVLENLEIGGFLLKDRKKLQSRVAWAFDLFPRLEERSKQKAGSLSGGEQQMLAIARALMLTPKILLLDEPTLGLAPNMINIVKKIIGELKIYGTSILLVEQNADMALSVADYAHVIYAGKIRKSGTPQIIKKEMDANKLYFLD